MTSRIHSYAANFFLLLFLGFATLASAQDLASFEKRVTVKTLAKRPDRNYLRAP